MNAKPLVRPRKAPGAILITHAAEVVQLPVKQQRMVKMRTPEQPPVPFWKRYAWLMGFLGFALAAWPLGALLRYVVR